MVSPNKRKPSKPARPRKSGQTTSVQIWTNIPFNKTAVVTRTQVTRKTNKRVVTKSTNVIIPITTFALPQPSDTPPPDQNEPQTFNQQTHKGPSRSVAVRSPFSLFYLSNY